MVFSTFLQIDLRSPIDTGFLFNTRSHPDVCRYLLGQPPVSYSDHMKWLKSNVPEKRKIFILRVDGKLVGYCQAYDFIDKETVEVGFVVHPDFQRRGYGKIMTREIIAWLRRQMSDRKIILYVLVGNKRAISLYGKYGFVQKERVGDTFRYEIKE